MIARIKEFNNIRLIKRAYTVLSSLIFLLSLKVVYHFTSGDFYNVEDVQFSFLVVSVFTAIFLTFTLLVCKSCMPVILSSIMVLGICLRICYTLVTDAGTRTYDVYRDSWGHLDYIKYIAQNLSLPPVNECQTYHPPIHHIISALMLNLSKLFTQNEFLQLKFVQLLMVLISSLTLIFFYKILKELKCNNIVVFTAVTLFAFHPLNIYFSSRINNDNTMFFFYTIAFYFLIKWINSSSWPDMVFLSLFAALAVLTKFSGIMLAPVIAFAFLMVFVKNLNKYKMLLRQFYIFALIYIPLSMSYQLRNYVLFNQKFSYVPSLGDGFTPTFYNLLHIPVNNFIESPFNNGGLKGGEFFLEFFLKSSLYGEWQYPGLEALALIMLSLASASAVIIFIYLVLPNKNTIKYRYIFILNLIIPIILAMKFRTDLPIACSQDFRYVAPVLISVAFLLGETVYSLKKTRFKILGYVLITGVLSFSILTTVFVLSLGYYN